MKYSITCPPPCNHEIKVDAQNDDEAIEKLLVAGKAHANKAHPGMSIPDQEMREMIRNTMEQS